MADSIECEVSGCGRKFTPGKNGASGRCWMHYMRAKRNSRHADEPEPIYAGNRTEQMTAYVTAAAKAKAEQLAKRGDKSISEWLSDAIDRFISQQGAKRGAQREQQRSKAR